MPFDPRQLAPIIASLGGLRGGSNAFMQRWQELEQQKAQQDRLAQQTAVQEEQLGFQRDANARAQSAEERAGQDQYLQSLTSVQNLLGSEAIDDPDIYNQREALALNVAPRLGLDPGYIQSLRPAPTVFQQWQARKKLKEIEGAYGASQIAMLEADDDTGAAPVFEVGSERLTLAQLRERAGVGVTLGGKVMSLRPKPKPDVLNTPEERIADALRRGDMAAVELEEDALRRTGNARRAPDDPVLGELRQLRLEQQRAGQASTALPPATQRRVDAKTRAFDSQPVVKRIQTMAESVTFAEGLNVNTTNPADDQALIYAFAKAMDPDSVVREGEYATVQRYAQSWAERFGFDVARMFSNTVFLTPQARANMKATIRSRFAAAKPQYENLRRSYSRQISQITQQGDGDTYLIDYAAAFPAAARETVPNPFRE